MASCEEGVNKSERSLWEIFCDWCEWVISDDAVPYVDATFFVASVVVLFLTMEMCQICVFGLLIVSLVFCCRFRYMFFILWACIGVLWIHGWRFGGGKGLSVQWN